MSHPSDSNEFEASGVRTVGFFSGTWETGGVLTVTLSLARSFHARGVSGDVLPHGCGTAFFASG